MQTTITTVLGLSIWASAQFAQAASPRLPITCNYAGATAGYEKFHFAAVIDPANRSIASRFFITNEHGVTVLQDGIRSTLDSTTRSLRIPLSTDSEITISSAILTSVSPVAGAWGERALTCSLLHTRLDNTLTAAAFDRFDLPFDASQRIKTKTWTSSDQRLSLTVELYPAAPATTHYPAIPARTNIVVSLAAAIIDDQPDHPEALWYLLYGDANEKILQTVLHNMDDIASLVNILNSDRATLNLVHPYGHSSPVQLDIDCSNGDLCTLTAH